MESYKYQSGPRDKNGDWPDRYALRSSKEERSQYEVFMANPELGSKRRPHIKVDELCEGIMIRRWVEL